MANNSSLPDLGILIPVVLLIFLGILVIYSSSPTLAIQQGVLALVGLGLFWLISLINFEVFNNLSKYLYIGIIVSLIIVYIVGIETRGSLRWLEIGPYNFQPSEFAKPILILFLAKFWTGRYPDWKNIIKSLLLMMPIGLLIFKQPDLGTFLTMMAIWLMVLLGANTSFVKILMMGAGTLVLAPVSWLLMKDYQKDRIFSFLSPEKDPLGIGYNVIQSTIAVGSGQFWGRGLGRGTQSRLQFLPEFRTDFIFASISEEIGLFGCLIVLTIYGWLMLRLFRLAAQVNSRFGAIVIFGSLGMLFFQVVVNIGMNIGIAPVTGITLPLLSYGGSSLISTLITLGLVCSVVRYSKPYQKDSSW